MEGNWVLKVNTKQKMPYVVLFASMSVSDMSVAAYSLA